MPFLEQRGPARAASARRFLSAPAAGLAAVRSLTGHWSLAWAALYFGGHLAGETLALRQGAPAVLLGGDHLAAAARLVGALPLLLAVPRLPAAPVWLLVCGGAALCGHQGAAVLARDAAGAPGALMQPAPQCGATGTARLRLTGWPLPTSSGGWQAPAVLLAYRPDGESACLRPPAALDGVLLRGQGPQPRFGELVQGRLRLRPPQPAALPGSFSDRAFLGGRSVQWRGTLQAAAGGRPLRQDVRARALGAVAGVKGSLVAAVQDVLPAPEAALARSVLLGDRTPESRAGSVPFTQVGLAHLFSVSGLHVGILLGVVLLPGRLLAWGPGARLLPFAAIMPLYCALTGAPASVVRAAGLAALILCGPVGGRRPRALDCLGLVYWLCILWQPASAADGGARLSYLAAAGLLVGSGWTDGFRCPGPKLARAAGAGLLVSLCAQWFTLPLAAASFGWLNLYAPLVNVLAVPLFGVALWAVAAAVLGSLVWEPLGQGLGAWAFLLLRGLRLAAAGVARRAEAGRIGLPVPGPAAWGAWLLLTLVLAEACRRRRQGRWTGPRTAAVAALALALGVCALHRCDRLLHPRHGPQAWVFDVGQGDCLILCFPDGWRCLIDTGETWGDAGDGPLARNVLPFLERQGIRSLQAAVLTHGHADHTGGAPALAARLPVREWYVAGTAGQGLPPGTAIRRPEAGFVLHRWRGWDLTVVHPPCGRQPPPGENDRSLVLALNRLGRPQALLAGDLEGAGERALLDAAALGGGAVVLKAGHHGSRTSSTPEFLQAVRPRLVAVSCGLGNRHGHPSHGPFVVDGDTVAAHRTDLEGSLRIDWAADGAVSWRASRGGAGRAGPP